jgi:hypothetical protein
VIRIDDREPGRPNVVLGAAAVLDRVTPYAAPDGWTLRDLDATGDVSAVYEPGTLALEEACPLPVAWDFLVRLAHAVHQAIWLDAVGRDTAGEPLRVWCFDSSYWECYGSPETEAAIARHFDRVTFLDPPPGEGAR